MTMYMMRKTAKGLRMRTRTLETRGRVLWIAIPRASGRMSDTANVAIFLYGMWRSASLRIAVPRVRIQSGIMTISIREVHSKEISAKF